MAPNPTNLRFGDMYGLKPFTCTWFGDIRGAKPYEFIRFGDIYGAAPPIGQKEVPGPNLAGCQNT